MTSHSPSFTVPALARQRLRESVRLFVRARPVLDEETRERCALALSPTSTSTGRPGRPDLSQAS